MTGLTILLVATLFLIFVAAELFTDALEHLGEKLSISEGVTGSLFAAVGTALPETFVPLLAIFAGTSDAQVNQEIGVGAILGAPLMLSTLTTGLLGLAALGSRGLSGRIHPERTGVKRDLNFFLFAFVVAALAMWIPVSEKPLRELFSVLLVFTYGAYVNATLRASGRLVSAGHGTRAEKPMMLSRLGLRTNWVSILIQLLGATCLLLAGAKGFIVGVHGVAQKLGISALLLSLLVIPIATELPEKINSILWIRKGRDTLALGNITGAMVFQGTLLPAMGILLTPWQPRIEVLGGVGVTLVAAFWLRLNVRHGNLPIAALVVNVALYAIYLGLTLA